MPYIEVKKSNSYEFFKRVIDLLVSCVSLIIFSPLILFVCIAIKMDSEGPIFADTPQRVGKNGTLFKMYKFRSMVEDAHSMLRENPEFAKLYDEYKKGSYKLINDPRITKLGKFLRKYSIDEIPQFINVLIGEMSVVGPRAYYTDEIQNQQKKYPMTKNAVKIVLSVKPGITGCWQVSGRSQINFDKRIAMDASYVKKRSVLYDLWIIAKTPLAMISGKGAI